MNKQKKNGFLWGMLGTLFVVLGVVAYVIFSSLLTRLFIGVRFGDDCAGAIMTLTTTGIIVSFVLYEAIFITWQIKIAKETAKNNDGFSMDKLLRIVAITCVSLSVVFATVSANTFTELRENSISKVCFVKTEEYRWSDGHHDVKRYTFICDESGGISFNVTMNDGEVVEILSGVTSLSDSFKEKYNTSSLHLLSYCALLAEDFSEADGDYHIECRISDTTVKNAKSFYESNEDQALIWAQIERIINSANAE